MQQTEGLNPADGTQIKCPDCQGVLFEPISSFEFYKFSKLITPTGKEEVVSVSRPKVKCLQCGRIDLLSILAGISDSTEGSEGSKSNLIT